MAKRPTCFSELHSQYGTIMSTPDSLLILCVINLAGVKLFVQCGNLIISC